MAARVSRKQQRRPREHSSWKSFALSTMYVGHDCRRDQVVRTRPLLLLHSDRDEPEAAPALFGNLYENVE